MFSFLFSLAFIVFLLLPSWECFINDDSNTFFHLFQWQTLHSTLDGHLFRYLDNDDSCMLLKSLKITFYLYISRRRNIRIGHWQISPQRPKRQYSELMQWNNFSWNWISRLGKCLSTLCCWGDHRTCWRKALPEQTEKWLHPAPQPAFWHLL